MKKTLAFVLFFCQILGPHWGWGGKDSETFLDVEASGPKTKPKKPYTLCIFDVDKVLIEKSDGIFHRTSTEFEGLFDEAALNYGNQHQMSQPQFDEIYRNKRRELTWASAWRMVSPAIIRSLQTYQRLKDCVVIAATNTEPFSRCLERKGYFYQVREASLEKVGVNFKKYLSGLWLNNYGAPQGAYPQLVPTYQNGILYTRGAEKGAAVEGLLQRLCASGRLGYPHKIFFIDDFRENIDSMEAFCKRAGIAFEGMEIEPLDRRPRPHDTNWHRYQLKVFFESGIWLGDDMKSRIPQRHNESLEVADSWKTIV